jgi:hypothetical protein
LVYDTGQADDAGLLALLQGGQPQINENQNSLGTTQSMSRVPDGVTASGGLRQTATYVTQAPTPATYNQALPFGVLVLQSAGHVDVVEGGTTDGYQLALLSIPTANVQITVDPDSQTDLGAGVGMPIMLTFTPANALIPQLITVAAVNDMIVEGSHTSTITHSVASADTRYNGFAISNVVASITDHVFLAGDYNSNGVVDSADYVLWRRTLGSTTDLRADGSGPSTGEPNGVVDQFDYAFWRANFDAVGGSGSGSGAGVAELAAASSVIEVSPAAITVPSPAVVESNQALDSAVADFNFVPPVENHKLRAKSSARSRAGLPFSTDSANPLLALARSERLTHRSDSSFAASHAAANDHCNDVDQLFASLESDFAAGIGSSLSLL